MTEQKDRIISYCIYHRDAYIRGTVVGKSVEHVERRFAASEDLLAACQSLVKTADWCAEEEEPLDFSTLTGLVDRARAAIEKVEVDQ